jgi:hypothetical protein
MELKDYIDKILKAKLQTYKENIENSRSDIMRLAWTIAYDDIETIIHELEKYVEA